MKKGMCFVWTAAALLVLVVGMGLGGPATASQSVDPCYKACFTKQADKPLAQKQDCNADVRRATATSATASASKPSGTPRSSLTVGKSVSGCPEVGDPPDVKPFSSPGKASLRKNGSAVSRPFLRTSYGL